MKKNTGTVHLSPDRIHCHPLVKKEYPRTQRTWGQLPVPVVGSLRALISVNKQVATTPEARRAEIDLKNKRDYI
jgi:hypothetical protein